MEKRVEGLREFFKIQRAITPFMEPNSMPIAEKDVAACDTAIYVLSRQAGEGHDRKYEAGGLEALARLDNTLPEVFPEGFVRSDENYKREILRLRIENERLKKNYALKKTPNGEQIFILLKEKSSK